MRYRIERDSLGERQVPAEAYYGIETLRGKENFEITKRGICRQLIKALAIVKKAAAKANIDAGNISEKVGKAIMLACDEILNGRLHGQFVTDLIQGGAGTSINMNANEVIANRANELLGGRKGDYDFVHPNDHVNFGQSTSDVIQTAGKIAVVKQLKKLQVELKKLYNSYLDKAEEFKDVIKTGRTHLQEALPITLGQEFYAYASALNRDIKRIDTAIDALLEVNLGGTAIGTGLNANEKYCKKVILHLSKFSGEDVRIAKNLIDATRNLDAFGYASSMLKLLAIDLSKTASDLRLMASSGPNGFNEIILPNVQPGSSIMPGKFNPVIPEVVNQVCFYVMGLDVTVTKAIEAGQLELNVFEPLILMSLFEEITTLRRAARTFNNLAITDLKVNPNLKYHIDNSVFLITALTPHIGYDTACSIVNEAMKENKTIKEIVLEKGLLSNSLIDEILNNRDITSSGIAGESILKGTK
ncbi:MAG: aspartate ammonia-lyase [Acholeplasmatales bacterium]|jgi:aspartate ammonia-lyase|nr:aspartate ammonia-lyase [Acholeplasmatales bacterium]MDD7395670.1 aspartate ammonia-lyase [Acholeplasmatales bacterium]CDD22152.1 fumarase [Firmicutes bacterium CAG:313]HCX07505.1 aspartate ammonia-lyase [Acholeplasmatales bacterium]